ncbi:MAG TPA: hypothetical protein DDW27_12845, partial [Bacteroidales bacterium]|nr:hypothetical protein [Bacteroidales bacterium]
MTAGNKKILVIDFTNFEDYPIGGYLSFARNLIASFDGDLALVGIVTERNEPVGKWFSKEIKGTVYNFFAIARYEKTRTKHAIPDRLMCFFLLRYYKSRILKPEYKNVFIQRQEILPAIKNFGFRNICYRFPGLENPLQISKYRFGRYLAKAFEKMFFNSIGNVNIILASGDEAAINDMINRSGGKVNRGSVIKFPTRINTDIYKPGNKEDARRILKIPAGETVVVTTGRLTALKGWRF